MQLERQTYPDQTTGENFKATRVQQRTSCTNNKHRRIHFVSWELEQAHLKGGTTPVPDTPFWRKQSAPELHTENTTVPRGRLFQLTSIESTFLTEPYRRQKRPRPMLDGASSTRPTTQMHSTQTRNKSAGRDDERQTHSTIKINANNLPAHASQPLTLSGFKARFAAGAPLLPLPPALGPTTLAVAIAAAAADRAPAPTTPVASGTGESCARMAPAAPDLGPTPFLGTTPTAVATGAVGAAAGTLATTASAVAVARWGLGPAAAAAAVMAVGGDAVSSADVVLATSWLVFLALGVLQRLVLPPRSLRGRFCGCGIGLRSVERRSSAWVGGVGFVGT